MNAVELARNLVAQHGQFIEISHGDFYACARPVINEESLCLARALLGAREALIGVATTGSSYARNVAIEALREMDGAYGGNDGTI